MHKCFKVSVLSVCFLPCVREHIQPCFLPHIFVVIVKVFLPCMWIIGNSCSMCSKPTQYCCDNSSYCGFARSQ